MLGLRSFRHTSMGFSPAVLTYRRGMHLPIDRTVPSVPGEMLTLSKCMHDWRRIVLTSFRAVHGCNFEIDYKFHGSEYYLGDNVDLLFPKPGLGGLYRFPPLGKEY